MSRSKVPSGRAWWCFVLMVVLCQHLSPSESFTMRPLYTPIYSNLHTAPCQQQSIGGMLKLNMNKGFYQSAHLLDSMSGSVEQIPNTSLAATSTPLSAPHPLSLFEKLKVVWEFTRPHTFIGSILSLTTLFMYTAPSTMWTTPHFLFSLIIALIPSLLTNLYITGLNQVTDVEIDIINKPYLPIPSGKLSKRNATILVIGSLIISLLFAAKVEFPLRMTILTSALLGTVYSLPPFRLKRFPLLAAFCILTVRGTVINLGFLLQAKEVLLGQTMTSWKWSNLVSQNPDSLAISAFFAAFGLIIALMKDAPDVAGDTQNNIPTFSVRLGAKRMFGLSLSMLVALLGSAAVVVFKTYGMNGFPVSAILTLFAIDAARRGKVVDTTSPDNIFSYYMYMWNIFYGCYLLLPFLRR